MKIYSHVHLAHVKKCRLICARTTVDPSVWTRHANFYTCSPRLSSRAELSEFTWSRLGCTRPFNHIAAGGSRSAMPPCTSEDEDPMTMGHVKVEWGCLICIYMLMSMEPSHDKKFIVSVPLSIIVRVNCMIQVLNTPINITGYAPISESVYDRKCIQYESLHRPYNQSYHAVCILSTRILHGSALC